MGLEPSVIPRPMAHALAACIPAGDWPERRPSTIQSISRDMATSGEHVVAEVPLNRPRCTADAMALKNTLTLFSSTPAKGFCQSGPFARNAAVTVTRLPGIRKGQVPSGFWETGIFPPPPL